MGHLIGRDGHGLRLATQLSGALISVAKPTTSPIGPRIVTIRGTTEQIGKSLVVMGKRIARQRVPNPRRRRSTHRDSVKPINVVAPFEDDWERESVPVRMEESHDEPAAGTTTSLSGEIPSDSEYLGEPMDICNANLEATIANPPSAIATVAETRAYCEELEAQTQHVEAEIRLLKLSSPHTSLLALPQPRGVADREETLVMCSRLLDQVFGPKPQSQLSLSSLERSPMVRTTTVVPQTATQTPGDLNNDAVSHTRPTALPRAPERSDTLRPQSQKVYPPTRPWPCDPDTLAMTETRTPGGRSDARPAVPATHGISALNTAASEQPVAATVTSPLVPPGTCNVYATTSHAHLTPPTPPESQHRAITSTPVIAPVADRSQLLPVARSVLTKGALTPPPSGSALLRTGVSVPMAVTPTSTESLRSQEAPSPSPSSSVHDVLGPTTPTKPPIATVEPTSIPIAAPPSASMLTPAQIRRAAAKVRKQAVAAKHSPAVPTMSAQPISDPIQSQPIAVTAPTPTSSEPPSGRVEVA